LKPDFLKKGYELLPEIAELLVKDNQTVATAESCTGGLVAHLLTNIPGSSEFMVGGIVSYSNKVKIDHLNVPLNLIEEHGAVSSVIAKNMAMEIRHKMGTDYGIATTGIAGPTGGSPEKPVGLVFLAVAGPDDLRLEKHIFSGNRIQNKHSFAMAALNLFYTMLLSET